MPPMTPYERKGLKRDSSVTLLMIRKGLLVASKCISRNSPRESVDCRKEPHFFCSYTQSDIAKVRRGNGRRVCWEIRQLPLDKSHGPPPLRSGQRPHNRSWTVVKPFNKRRRTDCLHHSGGQRLILLDRELDNVWHW